MLFGLSLLGGRGGPISLSANFDSPTGAAPCDTASRTVTVPTGNDGRIRVQFASASGAPSPRRSINGGTFVVFVDGAIFTVGGGETLQFRNNNAASSIGLRLWDEATGTEIGSVFTITCP